MLGAHPIAPPTADHQTIFEEQYEESLLGTNPGEIAIMNNGECKGVFPDAVEAATRGYEQFGEDNFSLHLIGTRTYYVAPIISTTPL